MRLFIAVFITTLLWIKPSPQLIQNSCIQFDQIGINRKVRFVAIGDYGEDGDNEKAIAELIYSLAPEFIITLGDNNYDIGAASTIDDNIGKYFSNYIFPYNGSYHSNATENRFFPSLGNHDWITNQGQPYFDYFSLPNNERYYQYSWGQTDFFVLNSNDAEPDGVGKSSVQAEWLRNALENSTAEWKIVYFHHAPYSSAQHGSYVPMQWPFKEWGASFVITGHEHIYERLEVDGLTYLISGLGGKSRYAFNEFLPESIVRYRENYGVLLVEVCRKTATFEFITVDNEVIDRFQIFHPLQNWIPAKLQVGKH